MVKVKICGNTNLEDALAAADFGADALGFIFYEKSPRYVSPEEARKIINRLPPFITTVGVFVNAPTAQVQETALRAGLDIVQLHGEEGPEVCNAVGGRVIKVFRIGGDAKFIRGMEEYDVSAFLLDTYSPASPGGTGETFNWDVAVDAKRHGRIILAGGLTPENVARAIDVVQPYAVDVASGVEERPGKKDFKKLKEFIERSKCL